MSIKEKAKLFAIKAHGSQNRKSEPDKLVVMHSISVGNLLEFFGCDDNVVAAGYLHDVVEDTKYTIDDIKKEFGSDVANLVMGASEKDKSLSWEERKIHTINESKTLPLRNKLIICADKINNLEDLYLKFEKEGKMDFSCFKRGEEKQRWYYTSIYESLIHDENKELPMFVRLKNIIDKLFYQKKDNHNLGNTIFIDDKDYYLELKKLHAMKTEVKRLKELCKLSKPFVVEFSGTPRTGKTTMINNLYDFFKKAGFNIKLIEEFTTSKYYKEVLKKKISNESIEKRNIIILNEVTKQLEEALNHSYDIILIDRSINDRLIWNNIKYNDGDMSKDTYYDLMNKYKTISSKLIDVLIITYADSLTSLKRDYLSSLSLEKRSFLNIDNIDKYNKALKKLNDLFSKSIDSYLLIDTSNVNLRDVSLKAAFKILPSMRKKYINEFKKDNNI